MKKISIAGAVRFLSAGGIFVVLAATLLWSPRVASLARAASEAATRPAAGSVPATPDYTADFKSGERPIEFSDGDVELTHDGDRPMLGRFGQAGVVFTLAALKPHEVIHVEVDLAMLNSWNGSSRIWGPDAWACDEGDGRLLLDATFSNCGFFSNNNEQSYPDVLPIPQGVDPHDAWTGAVEHETLGEPRRFAGMDPKFVKDCSSVYHLDWTFPHTKPELVLDFTSHQHDKGLRWALMGLRVTAVPKVPRLSGEQMTAAIKDLADIDAVKADKSLWRLAATGDAAVEFVRAHPAPANPTPYYKSRVSHLLQVIGTPAATKLYTDTKPDVNLNP